MLLVVGMILATAVVFATNLIMRTSRPSGQVEVTRTNFDKINTALIAFVTVNGRLPCPAKPGAVDGKADPDSATTNCGTPGGVVPWGTLGISAETAMDGWNRLISYRVLDGSRGLTQADGASMVNCDTYRPYSVDPLPGTGLCKADHSNLASQFLANKGLVINNDGTLVNGAAFVLISHGESGFGAYFSGGQRLQLPAGTAEVANTGTASPFYLSAHSPPGTDPATAGHFDDILVWMRIEDLVKKSGLTARDWPDPKALEISAATLSNMNTTSSDRFNASTATSGETFAATTSVSNGQSTATMAFGSGLTNQFANCAWWPTPFQIFNGVDRFTLRMYLEFSVADISRAGGTTNDFGGFVIGFLPYRSSAGVNTVIDPTLCGDDVFVRNIGWANEGSSGNLPSPRFGIEFDPRPNTVIPNDPANNHLAVDFNGTRHDDVDASRCFSSAYRHHLGDTNYPQCYTANSDQWLRDGLNKFHRMRIEISAYDAACAGGPRMQAWVIPETICPDGSVDALCVSSRSLADGFAPIDPLPPEVVMLNRCIDAPSPSNLYDQLYFGITAANGRASTAPALYLRNLGAGIY